MMRFSVLSYRFSVKDVPATDYRLLAARHHLEYAGPRR